MASALRHNDALARSTLHHWEISIVETSLCNFRSLAQSCSSAKMFSLAFRFNFLLNKELMKMLLIPGFLQSSTKILIIAQKHFSFCPSSGRRCRYHKLWSIHFVALSIMFFYALRGVRLANQSVLGNQTILRALEIVPVQVSRTFPQVAHVDLLENWPNQDIIFHQIIINKLQGEKVPKS